MKKSSKITVILLVLILIAILGLGGYVIYDLNNRVEEQANTINKLQASDDKTGDVLEENEVSVNSSNNTANTNNASTSSSSKKAEDYITMSEYEIEGDEYTEARTVEYPEINIDSSDVEEINSEIRYDILTVKELDYKVYLNNDILSLVIRIESRQNDNTWIIAKNVNVTTGEKVENSEILELKNISVSELKSQLTQLVKSSYADSDKENYTDLCFEEDPDYGTVGEEFYEYDLEYIDEICNDIDGIMQLYLNENGEICISTERMTYVDGETHVLNIDQNKDITDEIF